MFQEANSFRKRSLRKSGSYEEQIISKVGTNIRTCFRPNGGYFVYYSSKTSRSTREEQNHVFAHAEDFDFRTGCREFKYRAFINPFTSSSRNFRFALKLLRILIHGSG